MSGAKEIRSKIKSIRSTQKITRAMEMVAASKMRKAQQRMFASRPYSQRICSVIEHLAKGNPEYRHPYLEDREPKHIGLIVVATDRGLCGGLNVNSFRRLLTQLEAWDKEGKQISTCAIGHKAELFLRRMGGEFTSLRNAFGRYPIECRCDWPCWCDAKSLCGRTIRRALH